MFKHSYNQQILRIQHIEQKTKILFLAVQINLHKQIELLRIQFHIFELLINNIQNDSSQKQTNQQFHPSR